VPAFKPAYLIHGDDHGRIGERRSRLRAMAEAESGSSGVELFEGEACTGEAVAGALSALTFAMGRRFIIADGVERWKDADVSAVADAMRGMDATATTVAFFAREEGRTTVAPGLLTAVEAVGGVAAAERTAKAKELPKLLQAQARECGIELDLAAARALVAQVGERQQRLLREVEKLALDYGPGAQIGVDEVRAASASSSERKTWTLADALVAGDARTATRALLELRQQGERLPGLVYGMVRRLRDALQVAEALAAGQPAAEIKRSLRMAPFVADRLISDVRERDVDTYRRALALLADLELETRGGGASALGEETLAVRAVLTIAA
jgi:DNA polymerase III subunit delta